MRFLGVLIVSGAFLFTGCGNPPAKSSDSKTSAKKETSSKEKGDFNTFYVFKDKGARENHYVPSGFMPNGNCLDFTDMHMEGCQSGKTCIRVDYDVACSRKDQKWAGIYWLNPANNWGSRKGGYNLTGATQLTFWAKGAQGGEQIQEITVGGVEGKYPDSDKIIFGPIILSNEWKQYSVDLRGKDLSYISGGFSWSTEEAVNSSMCSFYLDEIKFE